jgi:hypothetical protein
VKKEPSATTKKETAKKETKTAKRPKELSVSIKKSSRKKNKKKLTG